MNRIDSATVEAKIRDGYNFDFGKYISDGFNIFAKEWLMFSLYGLVSTIILSISLFTVIGFILILYPTMLGFSIAAEKVERGERLEFNDFFGAFKNLGQFAVLGLIVFGGIVLILAIYFLMIFAMTANPSQEPNPIAMLGIMLFFFVAIIGYYILQVLMIFTPYLIHYGNYSAVDAIKTSISVAKKNFWWLLLFVFVVGIIASIGQYACLIGMFPSMAVAAVIQYVMAKDVLMNSEHSEIDQIGNQAYH